jgi:hypothetical protein
MSSVVEIVAEFSRREIILVVQHSDRIVQISPLLEILPGGTVLEGGALGVAGALISRPISISRTRCAGKFIAVFCNPLSYLSYLTRCLQRIQGIVQTAWQLLLHDGPLACMELFQAKTQA